MRLEDMGKVRSAASHREMLHEAIRLLKEWEVWMQHPDCKHDKKAFAEAVRNYNALRGVVKCLKWSLRFPNVD